MNNKKEQIKKAMAFVSAMSFISVTSFNSIDISAETVSETPALNSSVNPDDTTENETQLTSTTITTTTTATTQTSEEIIQTTTTTTATTQITEVPQTKTIKIMLNKSINWNEREEIKNKMADLSDNGIKNTITYDETNNIIILSYSTGAGNVEEKVANFLYESQAEKCIYVCNPSQGEISDFIIRKGYYLVENNSNGIVNISDKYNESIIEENGKTYIKANETINSDYFDIKSGYRLKSKQNNNITISAPIEISESEIKSGDRSLFSIVEDIINIYINASEGITVSGKDVSHMSLKDIITNTENINLKAVEGFKDIKANETFLKVKEYSGTIKDLLEKLGYSVTDEGITLDGNKVSDINIDVKGVPNSITLERVIDSKTSTAKYTIDEKGNILIPTIIKHNGVDYYLSKCAYNSTVISHTEPPAEYFTDKKYETIPYDSNLNIYITYSKCDTSDIKISKEEIIKALVKGNGENCFKRNDNVYNIKKESSTFSFDFSDDEDSDSADKDTTNKFNGITLRLEDNLGNIYKAGINNMSAVMRTGRDEIKFYKIVSIYDSENKSIPFSDPVYIYIDRKSPEVNVPDEYKEENASWSKKPTYEFYFSIDDGENITDEIREELKTDYGKINVNPSLASVKSINVGGYVFTAPDDGWEEETYTAENEENGIYNITITPSFSDDKTEFKAVFTLKDGEDSFDEKIGIFATDKGGNTSGTVEVPVKIDTQPPVINSGRIENITDGKSGNKVIEGNKELKIIANITDSPSGIASVKYRYGDNEIELKKNDENQGNNTIQNNGDEYIGTFPINYGVTDKLQIIVTDNAGNEEIYYCVVDAENNITVSTNEDDATNISSDNMPPVVGVSVSLPADYTDKDNQNWYKDYQDISISASDEDTGVAIISIKINSKETITIEKNIKDIFGTEEISENLTLRFTPCENNQQFNVKIADGENVNDDSFFMLAENLPLAENGRLEVGVSLTDYAGNSSENNENSNTVMYIDNNAPKSGGIIERDSEDVIFRKLGTFANKKVTVKAELNDINISADSSVASSGIEKENVELLFAGTKYQANKIENNYAYFEIPAELPDNTSIGGQLEMTARDNVGNEFKSTILLNEYGKSNVIIENKKPVINTTVKGDNEYHKGDEVWYNSDVTVNCNVSDNTDGDSGLSEVVFDRSQERANNKNVSAGESYTENEVMQAEYTLSTENGADGKAVFDIKVTDNAGNSADNQIVVYKDITKPIIRRFEFYSPVLSRSPVNIIMDKFERFGYFFDTSTVMTVYAEDTNASSGIRSIYCRLINPDGTVFSEQNVENPYFDAGSNIYSAEFEIPEGFKGDIRAWAVDNVKNTSDEVSPDGLASENQSRHDSHSSINIEMPQTEYSDINGLPLYSDNVTSTVIIEDDFSGIKTVEWTTSDMDGWQRIDIDDNGDIYGADGWSVDRKERNIALSVSSNITVSRDANENSIIVRITDNSGNVSEGEAHFSIDKQPPVISVSGIQQSQETKYYNSSQNAHIVISERNFNAPTVNGSPDGGFAEDPGSIINTDDFRHIKDVAFENDGTYSLEIEDTDLAGNVAEKYSSGTFVIDKTDPVLEVEFSKQGGGKADFEKNSYINDVVGANISIEELNFDSNRISIRINEKEYKPDDWKENNGKHTATIPYSEFKKDGEYTVTISGTDLAGNSFKSYSASFVIDTESPEIEFSGFETANKGDVAPVVKIGDVNLDDYELKVYRNSKLCEMSYDETKEIYNFSVSERGDFITGKWSEKTVDGKLQKEFVFDNFPSEECFDGSYRIEISAFDKAENSQNEKRQFSVNRFGSVFTVEDIENINGKYLNKAPDILITETNVDKHKEGSEIIVILDKGSVTEQLDETMYDISDAEMLDDKSGYVYNYVIKAENFNQDLDYRISIQTVDEAGNKNVSTSRGAELGFNVDTHEPEFKCDELIERAEFRESEKTFRLNVNEKLRHLTITTSLDEVLLDVDADDENDVNDNSYTFVMPASNSSRSVTVELTDLAGNKTIETYNNLLVTENMFLYLFHKVWIKVTGGIVVLGAGIGGFTLAGRKKRRRTK